ncbi:hypothetical protein [Pedobacter sp. MW01-1-1]|uniref:hypothetical protein n=1 Tax=Pedobacter sp. MW01-1-1 TaxID=3383027 RepID=UPI003FF033B7
MKKRTLLSILSLFCMLLTLGAQCKKETLYDSLGLPLENNNGKIVFACKINGENWISNSNLNSVGGGMDDKEAGIFGLNDSHDDNIFERLSINLKIIPSKMIYRLNDPVNQFALYTSGYNCFSTGSRLGMVKSSDGEVSFSRMDKVSRVISGTFWCDIPTDKCGVIKITDGRFYLRY